MEESLSPELGSNGLVGVLDPDEQRTSHPSPQVSTSPHQPHASVPLLNSLQLNVNTGRDESRVSPSDHPSKTLLSELPNLPNHFNMFKQSHIQGVEPGSLSFRKPKFFNSKSSPNKFKQPHTSKTDDRDHLIACLRGELSAANNIILSLCNHLQMIGNPSEHDALINQISVRKSFWEHLIVGTVSPIVEIEQCIQAIQWNRFGQVVVPGVDETGTFGHFIYTYVPPSSLWNEQQPSMVQVEGQSYGEDIAQGDCVVGHPIARSSHNDEVSTAQINDVAATTEIDNEFTMGSSVYSASSGDIAHKDEENVQEAENNDEGEDSGIEDDARIGEGCSDENHFEAGIESKQSHVVECDSGEHEHSTLRDDLVEVKQSGALDEVDELHLEKDIECSRDNLEVTPKLRMERGSSFVKPGDENGIMNNTGNDLHECAPISPADEDGIAYDEVYVQSFDAKNEEESLRIQDKFVKEGKKLTKREWGSCEDEVGSANWFDGDGNDIQQFCPSPADSGFSDVMMKKLRPLKLDVNEFKFSGDLPKCDSNFICYENVSGKLINVVEGLELYYNVFQAIECEKIIDYVNFLQILGRGRKLYGRTYLDSRKLVRGNGRITIQFGCFYNYMTDRKGNPPGIIQDEVVEHIPVFFNGIIDRLISCKIIEPEMRPDSLMINVYPVGACIPPHVDHDDFERPICTLSLLSECDVLFGYRLFPGSFGMFQGPFRLPLPPGSVLLMKGNSADIAKHAISSVSSSRISITFRKMKASKIPSKLPSSNRSAFSYDSCPQSPESNLTTGSLSSFINDHFNSWTINENLMQLSPTSVSSTPSFQTQQKVSLKSSSSSSSLNTLTITLTQPSPISDSSFLSEIPFEFRRGESSSTSAPSSNASSLPSSSFASPEREFKKTQEDVTGAEKDSQTEDHSHPGLSWAMIVKSADKASSSKKPPTTKVSTSMLSVPKHSSHSVGKMTPRRNPAANPTSLPIAEEDESLSSEVKRAPICMNQESLHQLFVQNAPPKLSVESSVPLPSPTLPPPKPMTHVAGLKNGRNHDNSAGDGKTSFGNTQRNLNVTDYSYLQTSPVLSRTISRDSAPSSPPNFTSIKGRSLSASHLPNSGSTKQKARNSPRSSLLTSPEVQEARAAAQEALRFISSPVKSFPTKILNNFPKRNSSYGSFFNSREMDSGFSTSSPKNSG